MKVDAGATQTPHNAVRPGLKASEMFPVRSTEWRIVEAAGRLVCLGVLKEIFKMINDSV